MQNVATTLLSSMYVVQRVCVERNVKCTRVQCNVIVQMACTMHAHGFLRVGWLPVTILAAWYSKMSWRRFLLLFILPAVLLDVFLSLFREAGTIRSPRIKFDVACAHAKRIKHRSRRKDERNIKGLPLFESTELVILSFLTEENRKEDVRM